MEKEDIRELAAAYCPEWSYEPGSAEPASVLLDLGMELLSENEAAVNALPETHRQRFLDALVIPTPDSHPMLTFLQFSGEEGTFRKNDRLFIQTEYGDTSLKLKEDCSVSGCTLSALALTDAKTQTVRIYKIEAEGGPTKPFSNTEPPEGCYYLLFSHPSLFRHGIGEFFLGLGEPSESLANLLCNRELARWCLLRGQEEQPLTPEAVSATELRFQPSEPVLHGEGSGLLRVDILEPNAFQDALLKTALIRFTCFFQQMEVCQEKNTAAATFLLFGDEPHPQSCCYMACEPAFSSDEAEITLRYFVRYPAVRRFPSAFESMEQNDRKPSPVVCHAERVAFEYWTGESWMELPETVGLRECFAVEAAQNTEQRLQFRRPTDWSQAIWCGRKRFWIRIRLLSAKNLYDPLCELHFPEIYGMEAFSESVISLEVQVGDGFQERLLKPEGPLLHGVESGEGRLYFQLDKKPSLPFRLYFDLCSKHTQPCVAGHWEYGDADGVFHPLAVEDGTEGLSHPGALGFSPPQDFDSHTRFGRYGYWLRAMPVPSADLSIFSVQPDCAVAELQGAALFCGTEVFLEYPPEHPVQIHTITACLGGEITPVASWSKESFYLRHLNQIVTVDDLSALLLHAFPEVSDVRVSEEDAGRIRIGLTFRGDMNPDLALYLRRNVILHFLQLHCRLNVTFQLEALPALQRAMATAQPQPPPDLGFTRLFERALEQIPLRTSHWNDLRSSDPGVTILESMAYLADQQRYYCGAVTDRHRLAYCRLLGLRPRSAVSARGLLISSSFHSDFCMRGKAVTVGGIPFEISGPLRLFSSKDISSLPGQKALFHAYPQAEELWALPVRQIETLVRRESWSGDGVKKVFPIRYPWRNNETWEALVRDSDGVWRVRPAAFFKGSETLELENAPPRGKKNVLLLRWGNGFDPILGETDGTPAQEFWLSAGLHVPAVLRLQISCGNGGWRDLAVCSHEAPEHAPLTGVRRRGDCIVTGDGRSFALLSPGCQLRVAGLVRFNGRCQLPPALPLDKMLFLTLDPGKDAQTASELLKELPAYLQTYAQRWHRAT